MTSNDTIKISLRQWIQEELHRQPLDQEQNDNSATIIQASRKKYFLCKTAVAYGIVELLRRADIIESEDATSSRVYSVDNFVVFKRSNISHQTSWDDITGIGMITPTLHAELAEPSFLGHFLDDDTEENVGAYLEVEISPPLPEGVNATVIRQTNGNRSYHCRNLGTMLYELYSGMAPSMTEDETHRLDYVGSDRQANGEPARKKATVRYDKKKGKSYSTTHHHSYTSLQELGFHSSICLLVQNLIDGSDLYPSLEAASKDIHLLLVDPDCYLSDLRTSTTLDGRVGLKIREGKLYGRETQTSLITEAFCRVSAGTSEAFFLGGYSGSGKTMLVDSITARVHIAGGYVLTQKVDQMSKDRPLLEVLAAFNNLCLMIKDAKPPEQLLSLTKALMDEFQNDFDVLARLLPNIVTLYPKKETSSATNEVRAEQALLASNIHFTLQRFMRVVSTESNPVVLFLDDCQWAGSPALDLIHAILTDTRGSTCFFFVGTYRDNEVDDGHPLMMLMANLDLASIETSHVNLSGLSPGDLNILVAESLCIFPRIVKPLSDIIFEKTYGNPFFALEFLKSLVASRLLKYSLREQRWIWDLDRIRSENITDNVLHLLSNKMASLPDNVQVAVKVLSCFGIKTDEAIVERLCLSTCYPDFRESLYSAISERCIQKKGSDFKFIHDKVREAAYELLPQHERRQFHHHLGVQLLSMAKNADLGSNVIFQIADQFNQDLTLVDPDTLKDVLELNVRAGSTAMDLSDFTTASSYLTNAHSLLPDDCWKEMYEFTMRLYYLSAKAAYSSGHSENAIKLLKAILDKGRCMEDKLDAQQLHLTILLASKKSNEVYLTCREFLSQFNENIPESFDRKRMSAIMTQTQTLMAKISDEEWLSMKKMTDSSFQAIIKFYSILLISCFFGTKQELIPFLCCRLIHITIEHGLCNDSILGLAQYALVLCQQDISFFQGAYRIGKVALKLMEHYNASHLLPSVYHCFYGFVAYHKEPYQHCLDMLRDGYKIGMSRGDTASALYNAIHIIRLGIQSGANLPSLLKETDGYLDNASKFVCAQAQTYLSLYREIITSLIDKGASNNTTQSIFADEKTPSLFKTVTTMRALEAYWLGHSSRCHFYVDKLLATVKAKQHINMHNIALYIGALTAFSGVKNRNGQGSRFARVSRMYKGAKKVLNSAAELCPWNFSHKVHLLEAENHSHNGNSEDANAQYEEAISLSRSHNFVHEQGLSAECAALHFKKIGDNEKAIHYFNEAIECYAKWGSQMKVDFITHQLAKMATAS